jgi:hypothetical protein
LLPCGIGSAIEPAIVGDLESIQHYVGGCIDAVRTELEDGTVIVGYCHDEGLLLGMETNWFASALFNQQLCGPVVLVSGTSPSGEYDGDNYDLPEQFYKYLTTKFTVRVAETYNETQIMSAGIALARRVGIVDAEEMAVLDEELERASTGDDDDFVAHMQDIAKRCETFGAPKESDTMESMISDIEKMLREAEGGK